MCDTRQPSRPEAKEAERGSTKPAPEPSKPKAKVCSCDKPCCRNQLIQQSAAAAGQPS